MLYKDFVLKLDNANKFNSEQISFNKESFARYISQIDICLSCYFAKEKFYIEFEILKGLQRGKTLAEMNFHSSLNLEIIEKNIKQIIANFNSDEYIEKDNSLTSLFSILNSIEDSEIFLFFDYLISKKHVLIFLLEKMLKQKGCFDLYFYETKDWNKKEILKIKKGKMASNDEIRKILEEHFYHKGMKITEISKIATQLVDEYNTTNKYNFSGKVGWNKVVNLLLEMRKKEK